MLAPPAEADLDARLRRIVHAVELPVRDDIGIEGVCPGWE
jgi:hypothetical protein